RLSVGPPEPLAGDPPQICHARKPRTRTMIPTVSPVVKRGFSLSVSRIPKCCSSCVSCVSGDGPHGKDRRSERQETPWRRDRRYPPRHRRCSNGFPRCEAPVVWHTIARGTLLSMKRGNRKPKRRTVEPKGVPMARMSEGQQGQQGQQGNLRDTA